MIFVWRGWGGLLVPTMIALSFMYLDHKPLIGLTLSSLVFAVAGFFLNHMARDSRTGKWHHRGWKNYWRTCHQFLFAPVEFWAIITPILYFFQDDYFGEIAITYLIIASIGTLVIEWRKRNQLL